MRLDVLRPIDAEDDRNNIYPNRFGLYTEFLEPTLNPTDFRSATVGDLQAKMKARIIQANPMYTYCDMTCLWLAICTQRITHFGFVAIVTEYRGNCHGISRQLPRNIVPTATFVVQGIVKSAMTLDFKVGSKN